MSTEHPAFSAWWQERGWTPAQFQRQAWLAYANGESGLIHSATGSGKTLAVWGGPLNAALQRAQSSGTKPPVPERGLRVLWITPLRALAADTQANLQRSAEGVGVNWAVGLRTGDTPTRVRTQQRQNPPQALVTTPESLSLLLSYANGERFFDQLEAVVVDEWHELMGTKRGVQLELCLARLRRLAPGLRTWGLSATLGNLAQAQACLFGVSHAPGRLIEGPAARRLTIRSVLPADTERFPWAGHLGTRLIDPVIEHLDQAGSALLFTNTRSQAERWFEALLRARSDWLEGLGLHHGSIDRGIRERIEQGLSAGQFRCVVATASLDLGVDFAPVDRVLQIGSPKGVARLAQRAGRSGHQPGAQSSILCVPTHAFELLEIAAARQAWEAGEIEARPALRDSLDVLAQHLVTLATGSGFLPDDLLAEVRSTYAYAELSDSAWQWTLAFIRHGGSVLAAYPDFQRVVEDVDGRFRIAGRRQASRHRMSIGTITSDTTMAVRYSGGGAIGRIEESFIARLKLGDTFLFAGRSLELVRVRELTAYVRRAPAKRQAVPRWQGGRLPLSSELSDRVLALLADSDRGQYTTPETQALQPLLAIQKAWSALPRPGRLLIEQKRTREGQHFFIFPFAGRLAHEGLATLCAWRLAQQTPTTFSLSVNDYGFELLSADHPLLSVEQVRDLFNPNQLADDLLASLNASELAKRQFRDIARIAGLVFSGYPGRGKSARQLQASSGLIFDTLMRYDPEHRLLHQAQREVLNEGLDLARIERTLNAIAQSDICLQTPERLTPLAFPLWAERLRNRLSSERWQDRVARMAAQLEKAAGAL